MRWSIGSLGVLATTLGAAASPLVPHEAVYELSLAAPSEDFVGIEGRIAFQLKQESCEAFDLDYRFVARFQQAGETLLTDQRTLARETVDGTDFTFETTTFVDGAEQSRTSGRATNDGEGTDVSMTAPVERIFDLPLSRFPLTHTGELITRARASERIIESRLFDGDEAAEKLLTTTAIVFPLDTDTDTNDRPEELRGLAAWRVDESYYNAESDSDGSAIFRTLYTLYENGVSDDLTLDFGDYALTGSLSQLTYFGVPPNCGTASE